MEWYWQKNRQKGKEKRTQEYPSINTLGNGLLIIGGLICGSSTKHSARMTQPIKIEPIFHLNFILSPVSNIWLIPLLVSLQFYNFTEVPIILES